MRGPVKNKVPDRPDAVASFFSACATRVLLWILESGAIVEGSGKFWKNTEVPNGYPYDQEGMSGEIIVLPTHTSP
jgi:hypothetical protein